MISASPPTSPDLQQLGEELQQHADAYAVTDDAVARCTYSIIANGGTFPGQRMTYVAGVQTSAILRIAEAHREVYHDTPCCTCTTISDALATLMAAQRLLQEAHVRELAHQARRRTPWGTRRWRGTRSQ